MLEVFSVDLHKYISEEKNNLREFFARAKAFYDVRFNSLPKFLGPKIDIYVMVSRAGTRLLFCFFLITIDLR